MSQRGIVYDSSNSEKGTVMAYARLRAQVIISQIVLQKFTRGQ